MPKSKNKSISLFSPVFLLCSERSGSNLFVRLLDSHAEFCGPPPSHLIRTLALNLTRFGDIKHDVKAWNRLLDISVRIMQNQLGLWQYSWNVNKLSDCVTEKSVRGIISAVYGAESKAQDKTRCIIKENRIHTFLPFLMSAFPDARYIWVVRDPRDMALSWKKSSNHVGDVRKGSQIWQQDQQSFREIYGYLSPFKKIIRLSYEDIVKTPEPTLTTLCDFLSVEYDSAMLNFHDKEDTKVNAARIKNWQNLAKPLLSNNTEKFREALTAEEIAYVESICAAEMQAHGYVLTGKLQSRKKTLQALEAQQGEQNLAPQLRELTQQEQYIREGRQQVIDTINALPIRLVS